MIWLMLTFLLAMYGASLLVLFLTQRTFMYHPNLGEEKAFLSRSSAYGVLPWRDQSGKLIGWKREIPNAKRKMLIFHGNGGDALTRTYLMDGFSKGSNWNFYALEYPGYGWREGAATEKTILDAASIALQELQNNDAHPIYASGESLGTGVACLLAAKNPGVIQGLFLITPYTSTSDVAAGRFPFFPVRFLMQDRYDATRALKEYSGPVAILLAGNDFIVPTRFGQALFDGYKGPKKLWIQPSAGHNSLDFNPQLPLWKEAAHFLMTQKSTAKPREN